MPYRICLISLGCAKNQVNSEQMLYLLRQAGYEILPDPDGAELDFAILSLPDQPRIMALSGIKNVPLEPVPYPRRGAIVLDVADPDKAMAESAALGLKVYDEGRLETHDGRIGREIGIVDFDHNLVVIYQIPDAQS